MVERSRRALTIVYGSVCNQGQVGPVGVDLAQLLAEVVQPGQPKLLTKVGTRAQHLISVGVLPGKGREEQRDRFICVVECFQFGRHNGLVLCGCVRSPFMLRELSENTQKGVNIRLR